MKTHYNRYREVCIANGIDMQARCAPPKEIERLERLAAVAAGMDVDSQPE
jgi:hypothetical protein